MNCCRPVERWHVEISDQTEESPNNDVEITEERA
jgi:hypothetical protein